MKVGYESGRGDATTGFGGDDFNLGRSNPWFALIEANDGRSGQNLAYSHNIYIRKGSPYSLLLPTGHCSRRPQCCRGAYVSRSQATCKVSGYLRRQRSKTGIRLTVHVAAAESCRSCLTTAAVRLALLRRGGDCLRPLGQGLQGGQGFQGAVLLHPRNCRGFQHFFPSTIDRVVMTASALINEISSIDVRPNSPYSFVTLPNVR